MTTDEEIIEDALQKISGWWHIPNNTKHSLEDVLKYVIQQARADERNKQRR